MRILGMTFLNLAEGTPPECKVNMMETEVDLCGTVACHAGWFGIAKHSKKKSLNNLYDFQDSANEMANYLGFAKAIDLQTWAGENPVLWGNTKGFAMFNARRAFSVDEKWTPLDLEKIGLWWLGVADRCEAAL